MLKVSCIGYQTTVVDCSEFHGTVVLPFRAHQLEEAVVKGHHPVIQPTSDGLSVRIQGTPLGQTGGLTEVLGQMPYLRVDGNHVSVMGKGTPVIYINNRRVRDNQELYDIQGTDIKDITVITNPGSKYPSGVDAVILITTLKKGENGLTGLVQWTGRQRNTFSQMDYASLNYHLDAADFFASASYVADRQKQTQDNLLLLPLQKVVCSVLNNSSQTDSQKFLVATVGMNVAPQDGKLSAGIKYNLSRTIATPFDQNSMYTYTSDTETSSSQNDYHQNNQGYVHYVNTYLRQTFRQSWVLDMDVSYVHSDINTRMNTLERSGDEAVSVGSETGRRSRMLAERTSLLFNSGIGNFTWGNEYTYTDSRQDFQPNSSTENSLLLPSLNRVYQNFFTLFAEYRNTWRKCWTLNLGISYDYVKFDYFLNHLRQVDQSKRYQDVMPTFSVGYSRDRLTALLSFCATTLRPSYQELRSSLSYSNRYLYEGGNPSLQPVRKYDTSVRLGYGDWLLTASCIYYHDAILFYKYMEPAARVAVNSFLNKDYQTMSAMLVYAPVVNWWRPTVTLQYQMPHLSFGGEEYDKAMFQYSLKNLITLPGSYYLTVNVDGNTSGNSMLRKLEPQITLSASVSKRFGKAFVRVGVNDILHTQKEAWSMLSNEIFSTKTMVSDSRYVYLTLQYNFNARKDSYKGGKSGNEERNRL